MKMLPMGGIGCLRRACPAAGEAVGWDAWFPEFVSAVELTRRQTRAAGLADPVGEYFTALNEGHAHALETVWPGEVVIYDPHAGEVRGHRQVRRFIRNNLSWPAGLHARTETLASTCAGVRAVVELLAHLDHDGGKLLSPVAVVAESPDDLSVVFGTYCSKWPLGERRVVRPPILRPGHAPRSTTASAGPPRPAASGGTRVYERGPRGLLAAARAYDDAVRPPGHR